MKRSPSSLSVWARDFFDAFLPLFLFALALDLARPGLISSSVNLLAAGGLLTALALYLPLTLPAEGSVSRSPLYWLAALGVGAILFCAPAVSLAWNVISAVTGTVLVGLLYATPNK